MIVASGVSRTTGGSMRHQWPAVLCSVLALTIVTVGAQTPAKPAGKTYKAPRTAWGDPDISGNYTNKYEQGTPFERPPELEGRRLEDINAAELSKILKDRQTNSIERAPFNGGDPDGTHRRARRVPRQQRDPQGQLGVVRRRSAGRQDSPADARGAAAHPRGAPRRQQFQQRALQQPGRLQPLRSLHHARRSRAR